ncbi:NAD-dependent epimerase/dehydratase family protein [Paludisphaera mucosa]|uniref:NAD(P)-dependent oxidoreductase n=1 Tax=Paludisphaera mucosa TaxID=3030827 RepID=A0ABT6FGR4_9BACT|nr:NAD(P)-dependent oxidoreductase [Paludisphaera mucosa]MDG3006772.1 NAD(P)-dependent oxidoreductase [Paludisphaera mucosa]
MQPDPTQDPTGGDEPEALADGPRFLPPLHGGLPILDPDEAYVEDGEGFEPDEEFDEFDVDDEPRTVLITGACSDVGRKLRTAWEDVYDLILLDADPGEEDGDVFKVDLTAFDEEWTTHFHGVDTVVHLAAEPDEDATLADLVRPDLDVLANVLNASALAAVERIVFASSNQVMSGLRQRPPELISTDLPPNPAGVYGAIKLAAERFGRSLAHAFDVTFVAVRLGTVQPGANRPESLKDDWDRKLWLSNGDLVRLFDAAVEAEIEDRLFLVVNGVSRNQGALWDLTDAAEVLGYLPEDDAFAPRHQAEALDERHSH